MNLQADIRPRLLSANQRHCPAVEGAIFDGSSDLSALARGSGKNATAAPSRRDEKKIDPHCPIPQHIA
jgi:hypothetical protein